MKRPNIMELLKYFARKYPKFTVQLAAVMEGEKPAVRVEFELHGDDYARFIDLLTELGLVWFEYSLHPVRICCSSSLRDQVKIETKTSQYCSEMKNYSFIKFSVNLEDHELFWRSLLEGKIIPLEISGGKLNPADEIIIARDINELKSFLTQYAVARTQLHQLPYSMASRLFDRILGIAFGYPECCIEKFVNEREKRLFKEDYYFYESIVEEGLEKTIPIELKVVGHVPCSIYCEHSINLGKKYLSALRRLDPLAYEIAVNELIKPTLFIDLWHQISLSILDQTSADNLIKRARKNFLSVIEKNRLEVEEVVLAEINNLPSKYLADFAGTWWINVKPGNFVFLYNVTTSEEKLYRRHSQSNVADFRIYWYKFHRS